ncbi:hypothetical protein [Halomicrococcus gelatinilyticus]|uniref:hypothetical protein n=1 Tax=Halomicrococcus gelatinilyticus TaxID=1702103 RepID=UPI002E0F1AE7
MPSRRALLSAGVSVVATGLAGCLSSLTRGSDDPPERSPDSATGTRPTGTTGRSGTSDGPAETTGGTTTMRTASMEERTVSPERVDRGVPLALPDAGVSLDGQPAHALAVGTDDGEDPKPRHVWVWNGTDGETTVELRLTTAVLGGMPKKVFERSIPLDAGDAVAVSLRKPQNYVLTTRVGDRTHEVAYGYMDFDCNDAATDVVVTSDGIESSTVSTSMDCGTQTVV